MAKKGYTPEQIIKKKGVKSMSAIDVLSEEIMKRLNRPNNTFIPLIVRRLVPTEKEAKVILDYPSLPRR